MWLHRSIVSVVRVDRGQGEPTILPTASEKFSLSPLRTPELYFAASEPGQNSNSIFPKPKRATKKIYRAFRTYFFFFFAKSPFRPRDRLRLRGRGIETLEGIWTRKKSENCVQCLRVDVDRRRSFVSVRWNIRTRSRWSDTLAAGATRCLLHSYPNYFSMEVLVKWEKHLFPSGGKIELFAPFQSRLLFFAFLFFFF